MSYRLSPDFDWKERGSIISAVKRGSSYSLQARIWSRKKRKAISWTTIRAICQRADVQSVHPNTWDHGQSKQIIQQEKPGFLSRIFNNFFG